MRKLGVTLAIFLSATPACAQSFDPAPWLGDLEQARQAFHTKYANLEWLENEREIALDPLFNDLAARLRRARNEEDARAVFERLVRKTGDGHVEIDWREPSLASSVTSSSVQTVQSNPCEAMGFDARQNGPGTASAMPNYAQLAEDKANPFNAGIVTVADRKLGIIRIGVFQPQGFPDLCKAALEAERIPVDRSCDDRCQGQINDWIYPRLTAALEGRVRQLQRAGATVILVDITGNGGGSEWAEAVARIFSAARIVSERRGMVRGEHWAKQWRALGQQLRGFAASATGQDKNRLLAWADHADASLHEAEAACSTTGACKRIADAAFSAGLVGSAASGTFAGMPWGPMIFSPAQYPYHDGVWRGPLIVLVDDATGSAAEEFAAVLQDNKAAIVLGARTAGAGCGHTDGGDPVVLANSRAVLKLPDCVRYRADGSNEVRGIIPDVPVPVRYSDGARFRAQLVSRYLPEAIARARRLAASATASVP